MRWTVRVSEGEMFPKTHREVRYDFFRRQAVCWPLGFHWIGRLWWRVLSWTYCRSQPTELDNYLKDMSYLYCETLNVKTVALEDAVRRFQQILDLLRETVLESTDFASRQKNLRLLDDWNKRISYWQKAADVQPEEVLPWNHCSQRFREEVEELETE